MRAYDESVRESFCHLVLEEGRTIVSAARIVGIHRNTGSAWLRRFRIEELRRENTRLRRAEDDCNKELDDEKAQNNLLRRDNNELKRTIWELRRKAGSRQSPPVRLLIAGLRWLAGVLGAGAIDELFGFYAEVAKARKDQ